MWRYFIRSPHQCASSVGGIFSTGGHRRHELTTIRLDRQPRETASLCRAVSDRRRGPALPPGGAGGTRAPFRGYEGLPPSWSLALRASLTIARTDARIRLRLHQQSETIAAGDGACLECSL